MSLLDIGEGAPEAIELAVALCGLDRALLEGGVCIVEGLASGVEDLVVERRRSAGRVGESGDLVRAGRGARAARAERRCECACCPASHSCRIRARGREREPALSSLSSSSSSSSPSAPLALAPHLAHHVRRCFRPRPPRRSPEEDGRAQAQCVPPSRSRLTPSLLDPSSPLWPRPPSTQPLGMVCSGTRLTRTPHRTHQQAATRRPSAARSSPSRPRPRTTPSSATSSRSSTSRASAPSTRSTCSRRTASSTSSARLVRRRSSRSPRSLSPSARTLPSPRASRRRPRLISN